LHNCLPNPQTTVVGRKQNQCLSELVVAAAASPSTLFKQEEQEHDLMMDASEGNEQAHRS
jgi:hypothetical protein